MIMYASGNAQRCFGLFVVSIRSGGDGASDCTGVLEKSLVYCVVCPFVFPHCLGSVLQAGRSGDVHFCGLV